MQSALLEGPKGNVGIVHRSCKLVQENRAVPELLGRPIDLVVSQAPENPQKVAARSSAHHVAARRRR